MQHENHFANIDGTRKERELIYFLTCFAGSIGAIHVTERVILWLNLVFGHVPYVSPWGQEGDTIILLEELHIWKIGSNNFLPIVDI